MWIGQCAWSGPGPFGGQGIRWEKEDAWHGKDMLLEGCTTAIVEDPEGNIWIGVDDQLWQVQPDSETWSGFDLPPVPDGFSFFGAITAIKPDPDSGLWVTYLLCGGASCDTERLYFFDEGDWHLVPTPEWIYQLSGDIIYDDQGTIWFFPWKSGVFHLSINGLTEIAHLPVDDALIDDNGRIWVIADNLLWIANTAEP